MERADANLDVIQFPKSSAFIQFAALNEKPAHGVKRWLALFLTKLVKRFHHGAVQIPRPQIGTTVSRHFYACGFAEPRILIMRRPDLLEGFRVSKIEAIAQINHRAQRRRMLDLAPAPFAFCLGPASCPRWAVLPKVKAVAKPVPRILAGMQRLSQGNDFPGDANIAPVIPDHQGLGNHQRNCGFSLPPGVYMPVAARKRRMDFLSEAMRLPVARN